MLAHNILGDLRNLDDRVFSQRSIVDALAWTSLDLSAGDLY